VEGVVGAGELAEVVRRLRPRDTDFYRLDVAERDVDAAWAVVRELPLDRLVLAGVRAGPALERLVRAALGYDPAAQAFLSYLQGAFLPPGDVPPVPLRLLATTRGLALGLPGDPVAHGLFPCGVTKLARLALARQRDYPAEAVRAAAVAAFDGPYHRHDAFACAVVHPDVDTDALVWQHSRRGRGHRSRRKTARILAWGRRHGYLPEPLICGCRHERLSEPDTWWEAVRLADNWTRILPILDRVADDPARRLAVHRCSRCERLWAQDTVTSGQADREYGYPIATTDPVGWLEVSRPRHLY
jgi:hypothetical protein